MNGGIIPGGQISPYKTGERGLALKHHAAVEETGPADRIILLYGRGYISSQMPGDLIPRGIRSVFRLKKGRYRRTGSMRGNGRVPDLEDRRHGPHRAGREDHFGERRD